MSDNLLDKVNTLEIQLAELKNELMRQPFERKVCIGELKYDRNLNIVVEHEKFLGKRSIRDLVMGNGEDVNGDRKSDTTTRQMR